MKRKTHSYLSGTEFDFKCLVKACAGVELHGRRIANLREQKVVLEHFDELEVVKRLLFTYYTEHATDKSIVASDLDPVIITSRATLLVDMHVCMLKLASEVEYRMRFGHWYYMDKELKKQEQRFDVSVDW